FGLTGKHIAAPDEHVSDMAAEAGRRLLAERDVDPASVDAVLYFGSTWKDYPVWQAAPRVAHLLGCRDAFALELDYVSCGSPVALRVGRDLLAAEPELRRVLLVAASRESYLVDPANRGTRFALNFGDGAIAALLSRDEAAERPALGTVLGSHGLTDGSFSRHVKVPAGGSVRPASARTVADGAHVLDVEDLDVLKTRLDEASLPAFLTAAEGAVKRSGATLDDVDFVCGIHLKASMQRALLAELGVAPDRAADLADTGHMSGVDPLFGFDRAYRAGRLRPGTLCLLLAAGTGYTWAATCVRVG
ncbi:MAG: 3-oxoacyl-[acyl-carrier-protein] synthase III C-terminal domain-containing protein, partial [Trebonia sp.]